MPTDKLMARRRISISQFIEKAPAELDLKIISGESGLTTRFLSSDRIQKLGLGLAGYTDYIHPGRLQVVGQSEISYLAQLPADERATSFENLRSIAPAAILLTKSLKPPSELLAFAAEGNIPLLQTSLVSSAAIGLVTNLLQESLAPELIVHGVLLGMYDIGVIVIGESGIGKSECALDLISRGHRLVSDDSVTIRRIGRRLNGSAPELTREHLEIHGLGIINIKDLFGVSSVGSPTTIRLCIELKRWADTENIERIGLTADRHEILGVGLPKLVLPVRPGRNMATIVETAVRVFLLREAGFDPAKQLIEKHSRIVGGDSGTV